MVSSCRPRGGLERAVCIPAHGAVIGAWVGAFPMPLDWERPWQVGNALNPELIRNNMTYVHCEYRVGDDPLLTW